jgi:8-amino-7-oxononanoate synthase
LDETLAAFKGTEAAISFPTGYAAAIGAICALLGKDDVLILDKLVHACIVDAAHLCGAKLRVFDHNDLTDLEAKLKWAAERVQSRKARTLVVTESVFSMDGDHAPLQEMARLKEQYGAWLMVDEAHATGLYGAHRRGLAEELGVSDRIEVQMGTLGKALGASGGYICGSRVLIDYLINRARTFIFSTAPVPAAVAAATAGIRFVQSSAGEERRSKLWQLVSQVSSALNPQPSARQSAIIPILIGEETKAVEAAAALRERGIFLPAIRYPTVARGQARLRLTLSAAHTQADLADLLDALRPLDFGL